MFQAGDEKESQHVPSCSFTSEDKYIMRIYIYIYIYFFFPEGTK